MGLWAALAEVFPQTWHQRCWFHKTGNVLNAAPKSQHGRAKAGLQEIWQAATREDALVAFNRFVDVYSAKYPRLRAWDWLRRLKTRRPTLFAHWTLRATAGR